MGNPSHPRVSSGGGALILSSLLPHSSRREGPMPSPPPPASEPKMQPSADEMSATGLEGATPSPVEPPLVEKTLSAEKIPPMKALNGVPFDPSAEETPSTELEGATLSTVEKPHEGIMQSVVKQPLSSEKIPSRKASSRKHFAWIEVRSSRYLLGVPDSHGAVLFVVLVSVLYALLTPWLLRRVAGQPTGFVWTISVLASSYFFIGAIRFSVTMGFLAIFFRISYVALLSVAATHFIGSNSGAAVATLLTFYAAGIFGHTIAEYVQRARSEEDQEVPSGCKEDQRQKQPDQHQKQPSGCKEDQHQKQSSGCKEDQQQKQPSGCKEDQQQKQPSGCKKDQEKLDEPLICFLFVHGFQSLFILMRMVWVVLRPRSVLFNSATDNRTPEAFLVVEEFSLETLFLIWSWASFVAVVLQKETVVSRNTMVHKVPGCVFALLILSGVFSVALGEAYGLLVLWPTPMAMAGLFGYILAMFSRYNHIHAKDQQPVVQKVCVIA